MNELALFAGAGGGILASSLLGFRILGAVEIRSYAIDCIRQRENEGNLERFPIWDDILTFPGSAFKGKVDIVTGGFPCQAFSTATHGEADDEKDLWHAMRTVIEQTQPKLVFGENVSLSAIVRAAGECEKLKDEQGQSYHTILAAVSARDVGGDHSRPRYWFLAYTDLCGELLSPFNVQARGVQELNPSIWEQKPEGWNKRTLSKRHKLTSRRSRQGETRQMGEEVAVPEESKSSPKSNRSRMVDGVARWMDRYKGIGNGQVELVATVAFLAAAEKAKEDLKQRNKM